MPQGYLVTLGDGNLDDGDFISASQSTFTIDSMIGTGSWIWTGSYLRDNGRERDATDYQDTGTYYTGNDGNVYFIPDTRMPISGSGSAVNPPTYVALDGTVEGTSGDDVIDTTYTGDPDGDVVDGGDNAGTDQDYIVAGAGNDYVNAGDADDTVFGGSGNDTIEGGQGSDSIDGGAGDDVIHGDTDGPVAINTTQFRWSTQGIADETSVATSGVTGDTVNGEIQVEMSITQEENFTGASMETNDALYNFDSRSDTSSIEIYGGGSQTGQNAATMTMDFTSNDPATISDEVMDVSFGIFDLDELVGQFLDQVIITAYDADGNPVDVVLTAGNSGTIAVDNATGTATAIGNSNGGGSTNSLTGFVQVSVAGPVARIVIDYNNVDDDFGNHAIRVGDLELTTIEAVDPATSADVITGGDGADVIYGGEGNDTVDGNADADTVYGGSGNDTLSGSGGADSIFGGSGTDSLYGGDDDDTLYGGADNDALFGGEGSDTLDGGTGNDSLFGGAGSDTLTGGDGNDTLTGGADQDVIYGGAGDVVDGSETGVDNDTLIVSGVDYIAYDASNSENGVVYFDGGGSLTFSNIENVIVSDRDGTVSGTSGGDLINAAYVGDPDGDRVDNNDAILVGDTGNDDLIEAGAGDDTIFAGLGADEIYAGTGNDTVSAGSGNDTLFGEAGNDILNAQGGADTVYGGSGNDTINGGAGTDSLYGGADRDRFVLESGFGTDLIEGGETGDDTDTVWSTTSADVTVTLTGDEAGTLTDGTSSATFSEIEAIETEDGNDTVDMSADSSGMAASTGAGNDTVIGGSGDDDITTGSGNDTVIANSGNNTITLGTGNDTVTLGTGNDTVFGGTGSDTFNVDDASGTNTITGGEGNGGVLGDVINSTGASDVTVTTIGDEAGILTTGTTTVNFTQIEAIQTAGGNDTIDLSNDTSGMSVSTGAGSDTITSGAGDDDLSGGEGSDVFIIGEGFGNDTITGGEDPSTFDFDVIDSGGMTSAVTLNFTGPEAGTLSDGTNTATFTETEAFILGSGSDTVIGGAGNENVYAGAGNDTMSGGAGRDTLYGGSGNDDITFSDGDSISGGTGNDTFTLEDLGEASNGTITIDGGSGSETGGDTLNIGSLGVLTQEVRDTFVDDGTGSFSGSITLDDGTILDFSEIENIICFTPQTRIATPKGLVEVQDLEVGDLVVTRDHGLQPIRWIEGRTVPAVDRFAPVRIRKNVLEGQDRDLIVSPQHRVLFHGYRAELLFGESEVLVAATHLVDGMDVTQDEAEMVTYVHMLFDHHEVIYAEGAATESFHPGGIGFSAVGDAAREELFTVFPELRVDPRAYGSTARRCLKSHEAKLIRT